MYREYHLYQWRDEVQLLGANVSEIWPIIDPVISKVHKEESMRHSIILHTMPAKFGSFSGLLE